MANSQQNPFLDLTADINVQGIVDSLKDASTQTQINAAFEKLFAAGTKEAAKEAVDDFINAFQSLKNKAPQDIFKDTFKPAELKGAETQLKNIFAQIDGFLAGTKNADFSNNVVVQLLKRITDAGTRIAELNKTKVNIEVNPASFKSFDDLARRLELALADVARLNEELAQGVAQGNLKVSPEVQNSVENTANQVANLGKQVEFLSKEVLAFISVLQTKIGETSGATSFVGKILGIDSETILKQLGDFTKQLEDLGRRSSQSFAKGFAEGGQDSARDAVRSIVSDLATELTKIKDLSTIKFEGLGQFDKITTAADALLDVLDKVVGKELQVEDLFNKVITGKGRTKFRPVAPIELPEGTIGLDKSLSPEKASQVVKSLNETFFQRIVSYAVESSRQFRNAFTEANNALEIDFRATFQTITEILEKFVATAETLVPKIFKLGQGEGDSDAKLISERLKSIQEEITKTEEAQAAARTKAQKKEFDQKIESLKLYQKGLESAQAKGGFTVGGTAAEEHLDKEAKQLQEIVNLIVEIGKQSKIAGVLILLKGPNEHFAKEIELLKGINSQIVQVGNAAQVASLEVAKLGDNVKLEQFKKNLGEIQAALELAREQLSSSKGTAEIGDLLVIDQRKVKARLAEVEAAIREFTARAQADLKAPGTTQIRELEDRLRRLRDDAREVSSLLREAKTPDDFRVLGDAKQEIKEEILEVRDALIKARREFQDNLSGDFKAEIASLKKARADLLAEKNKLSREFDASYSKELNSLIASLEKKIQALEKEEAKLKGIILGSEQPQTGGAQEDQEDQRIKAAKATADAIKEIEKA
ncbi:MAG TPA: hypothetical protein PK671_00340, partial [Candidatus Obscuribacter sp.]|nr:hypothetical protein [Candidatus Obscuribacter sp.]